MSTSMDDILTGLRARHDLLERAISSLELYSGLGDIKLPAAALERPKTLHEAVKRSNGKGKRLCTGCGKSNDTVKGLRCRTCLAAYQREWYARKHGKAEQAEAEAEEVTTVPGQGGAIHVCKLCNSPASSAERLAKHMARVHGGEK